MRLSLIIPLVISVGILVGFYRWYKSKMADLTNDDAPRPVASARLTSERLRDLASPPWRVVYEVGEKHLGDIDHVIIGSGGAIAIETLLTDRTRPPAELAADPQAVARAALARADVDELATQAGSSCAILAKVYWGTPRPDFPPSFDVCAGLVWVEGQRLMEWLVSLPPGMLGQAQVDQVWQSVLTGIGRPDPL